MHLNALARSLSRSAAPHYLYIDRRHSDVPFPIYGNNSLCECVCVCARRNLPSSCARLGTGARGFSHKHTQPQREIPERARAACARAVAITARGARLQPPPPSIIGDGARRGAPDQWPGRTSNRLVFICILTMRGWQADTSLEPQILCFIFTAIRLNGA